jgi:undecaprenyl-diphosphatase
MPIHADPPAGAIGVRETSVLPAGEGVYRSASSEAARLRRRRLVFVVLALACVLAFWGLATQAWDGRISDLDQQIQRAVQASRQRALTRVLREVSDLGSSTFLLPANLLLIFVLRSHRPRLALLLPALTLSSWAVESVLKWIVARPRPNLADYGFPSGHVFVAVVFFGGLIYVLALLETQRGWRLASAGLSAVAIVGIAYSRLYLNSHWLSDALGGLAGGGAFLFGALAVADGWARALGPSPR